MGKQQQIRIVRLVEFGRTQPHGTRSRYSSGCRCAECKETNRKYEVERVRRRILHGPARVPTNRVQAHMRALQAAGVGRHAIAKAAGITDARVYEILKGKRQHCKAETARRILSVSKADRADGAFVSAAATWRLIDELVSDGYTKTQLAAWLGYKYPAIQLPRTQVTRLSADKVLALYRKLKGGFITRSA